MTPDELKALPKGEFIVMKTGCHPMRTRLRLFLEWGITFEEPYIVPPRENAQVRYAGRRELMNSIMQRYEFAQSRSGVMPLDSEKGERNKNAAGSENHCLRFGTVLLHCQAGPEGVRTYRLDTNTVQISGKWQQYVQFVYHPTVVAIAHGTEKQK